MGSFMVFNYKSLTYFVKFQSTFFKEFETISENFVTDTVLYIAQISKLLEMCF